MENDDPRPASARARRTQSAGYLFLAWIAILTAMYFRNFGYVAEIALRHIG